MGAVGHELAITHMKKGEMNDDIWKERDKTTNNKSRFRINHSLLGRIVFLG